MVDHNINIGHCKVYSRDFVTNISWFIKLLNSEFRNLNSEFRILNCLFRILNSEFRIMNSEFRIPHFEKKVVDGNFVFWRCHIRVRAWCGARDSKLEQIKQ